MASIANSEKTPHADDPNNLDSIKKFKKVISQIENEYQKRKDNMKSHKFSSYILKSSLNLVHEGGNDTCQAVSNLKSLYSSWSTGCNNELHIITNSLNDMSHTHKTNFDEKTHIFRESYLSVLFEHEKPIKSLYYYCVCFFFWFLCWVCVEDFKNTGYMLDLSTFKLRLSKFNYVIAALPVIHLSSLFVILLIQALKSYLSKNKQRVIPYYFLILVYLSYLFTLYFLCCKYVYANQIFETSGLIIGCELARTSLKIHGYFREKLLYGFKDYHLEYANFKPSKVAGHIVNPEIVVEGFAKEFFKFAYYFFCPSLIYRDSYPRIKMVRWNKIAGHTFNFLAAILSMYVLYRYVCDPFIINYSVKNYYSLAQFFYDSLTMSFPGICFLTVGFFMILHTWLNLWSELIRHGDRKFYEDWWNCTNFEEYYRKWNMVVHEWLYYYVYNDVIRFSKGKLSKNVAKMFVFLLSVIVHEIVVVFFLGFFFPVLSLFFGGPGIIFTYIKTRNKMFNTMIWTKLMLGLGIIVALYLREFNSRLKFSDIELTDQSHSLIPRSILIYFSEYRALLKTDG